VRARSSERPVPLKPPRAGAAASIESVADAAAAASITPDWAISVARAEQQAACPAQASEREQEQHRSRAKPTQPRRRASHPTGRSAECAPSSERPVPLKLPRESKSSFVRERSRRSRGSEHHTRQGDQRGTRRAASGLCHSSFRDRARATLIKSEADASAAASVTPDRAISGARAEQRAACAAQASEGRARAAASIESVADAAAAASITPDRAISVARAEQRADCAAQASGIEPEQH
jgi:hypothetical protein